MQLTDEQSALLYPVKSERLFIINHSLNESDCISRLLNSVKPLTTNVLSFIDTRTTDNTAQLAADTGAIVEPLIWTHSFSRAKNRCIQITSNKYGLQYGDWIMCLGADFGLQPLAVESIKSFIKNPNEFFGSLNVREYAPNRVTIFPRLLLWRHHPSIFWERSSHEHVEYSIHRLIKNTLGIIPNVPRNTSNAGGKYGLRHWQDNITSEIFKRKREYYYLLFQLDSIMYLNGLPNTINGMLDALALVYGERPTELDTPLQSILNGALIGQSPITSRPDWKAMLDNYLER